MVQKQIVELIDDVTGEPAQETVGFGLDGVVYEIDLTTASAAELRSSLNPWVSAGRRVGGTRKSASGIAPGRRAELAKIRDWARSNGYQVSDRGRVAADIVDAYDEAHS